MTLVDGVVDDLSLSANIAFTFGTFASNPFNGTLSLTESTFALFVDETEDAGFAVRQVWDFSGAVETVPELDPSAPVVPLQLAILIVGGEVVLEFPTHRGHTHQVKWTASLGAGPVDTWNDLGSPIVGDGTTKRVTDEGLSEQNPRFYSVVISN